MRPWVLALLLGLLLIGLAPTPAHACKSAWPATVRVQRPTWPESAKLELVDEQIELECDPGRTNTRRCRWRALYVYEGEPGTAVDGELMLPDDLLLERAQLRVNGQAVPIMGVLDEVGREPERLHIEDAGRVEIELELEADLWTNENDRCMWGAGYARHPIVSVEPRATYFAIDEGGPKPPPRARTRLRVHAPPGWRVLVDDGPDSRSRELDAALSSGQLRYLTLRNRPLAHGPFVAAGAGFGPQVRARLRAGYEIAAPSFLIYSLAVEGDATEELMLIPAIEVASPAMLIGLIPSAGLGIGAPVMLLPDPLAGVRTQLSVMWPFVGLLGSVDVYPRPGKPAVRGAIMLQLSI